MLNEYNNLVRHAHHVFLVVVVVVSRPSTRTSHSSNCAKPPTIAGSSRKPRSPCSSTKSSIKQRRCSRSCTAAPVTRELDLLLRGEVREDFLLELPALSARACESRREIDGLGRRPRSSPILRSSSMIGRSNSRIDAIGKWSPASETGRTRRSDRTATTAMELARPPEGPQDEDMYCNFGMARPEGYRKATRLMRMASRARRRMKHRNMATAPRLRRSRAARSTSGGRLGYN